MRKPWLLHSFPKTLTVTLNLVRSFSSSGAGAGAGVAVKKVTRANFELAIEDLRSRIREADFVAIDLEMTGITSAPWRDSFEFDRSDVRYLKVKDSVEKFAVVQFGVCPFRWDSSKGSFIAHPHNFYIFPRRELPVDGPAYEFLCQTSSLNFLAKYQFDFNACIYEGISYLSRAQEAEAFRNLSSTYARGLTNLNSEECVEIPLVSTTDLLFTERMKLRFHEWRDSILRRPGDSCPLEGNLDGPKTQFETVFFKMRPTVMLNGFSSHQLKLIKLVIRKHFKDLLYVRVNGEDDSWRKIVVYIESEEDKSSFLKEVHNDVHKSSEAKVHSAVGFRHVIDILASEQKLIVGHNCFLDIAHIFSKFVGPLPTSLKDFALSVHKSFPYIIDTKHLINSSGAIQYLMKKSSRSLSSAFSLLCPKISSGSQNSASDSYVKVDVEAGDIGSSCWNSGAKHEAGYDAFMTGCVFAQACSHLGIKFELDSPMKDLAKNDKLQSFINILYPSWNSGTVINLSTGTETSESTYKRKYPGVVFSNIVLLWGFPSNLSPKDLKECVTKVFGSDSVTSVFFLDATAAFIQFSKEEFVNDFLILKDTLERDDDVISTLHPLSKLLEGGNTRAANYEAYKEICSASMSKVMFADQAEALGIRWKTKVEPGRTDPEESACSESTEESSLPPSIVKQVNARKTDQERRTHHQVSCDDILDSLFASKSLTGKQMRKM